MNLLESARLEMEALKRQRDAVLAAFDARLAAVEQTIKILDPVYSPVPDISVPVLDDSVGITEAIERALRKYPGKLLPPTSVRNALFEMGFKVAGNNPMASVHQVLKRLVARGGSPYVYEQIDGQTQYKFDPSREAAKARSITDVPEIWGLVPTTDTSIVAKAFSEAQRAAVERVVELQNAINEAQKAAAEQVAEVIKATDLSKHTAIKAIAAMQQRNKK